jgi:site-specific DNA-cytosine methylase
LFGFHTSIIQQPKDKKILLKDVLQPEEEIEEKYYLSEKMIEGFKLHAQRHEDKGTGFAWNPTEGENKGACLRANGALCPTDNIIKITGGDFRFDEGFRPRLGGKTNTLCLNDNSFVFANNHPFRRLTPIECERLQTVADNYTEGVSDSQRYKMLGNGWTVDVIAHIFKYMNV